MEKMEKCRMKSEKFASQQALRPRLLLAVLDLVLPIANYVP